MFERDNWNDFDAYTGDLPPNLKLVESDDGFYDELDMFEERESDE